MTFYVVGQNEFAAYWTFYTCKKQNKNRELEIVIRYICLNYENSQQKYNDCLIIA